MADLSNIEAGLVDIAAAALLGAAYLPGALATTTGGIPIKIYRGWPVPALLDADLIAGRAHVSVYADAAMSRNVTRFQNPAYIIATVVPTLTVAVAGAVVTFGGTGSAGNVAGVQVGSGRLQTAYAVRLVGGNTPTTVAAAFAAQIAGGSSIGAMLTIATNQNVTARVVADQPTQREVRRQQTAFRLCCWCATPQQRDALAGTLDAALADIRFFTASDGTAARLIYTGGYSSDEPGKDRLWRRDLRYQVEYATTIAETLPEVLAVGVTATAGGTNITSFGAFGGTALGAFVLNTSTLG